MGVGSLDNDLFFWKLYRMKFLNITAWKFSPMILARVSLPNTRHFTSSYALTVILRIVL